MSLIEKTTEIGNSIIALIDAKTGGTPDGKTIKSTDGVMSAIGVKESNKDKAIKTWVGTLEEYSALESVDENTLYNITDDVEGEEVFTTTKVNLDGSNYKGSGLQTVVDSNLNSKMTNCITEIPQRIKYTLVDGTLTIKAGSVVIVPYGTEDKTAEFPVGARFLHDNFKVYDTQFAGGKFFVWAELVNDKDMVTPATSRTGAFADVIFNSGTIFPAVAHSSGTTAPANGRFYNTETNIFYDVADNVDALGNAYHSFPFLLCDFDVDKGYTNVSQVFNGFGYIGKIFWIDKGIKVLVPNRRNADGTLNNIEATSPRLIVHPEMNITGECTFSITYSGNPTVTSVDRTYIQNSTPTFQTSSCWYSPADNVMLKSLAGTTSWKDSFKCANIGRIKYDSGIITDFQVDLPARILTAGDSNEISSYAMPSSKFIDLTLGASGAQYIAPANGWYSVDLISASTSAFGEFYKNGARIAHRVHSVNNQSIPFYAPFRQGDVLDIKYSNATLSHFRFYYAEGEV